MSSFDLIIAKLNAFTKKYYTKLLVKGCLLFFTLGLLFFFTITAVEYFLWLDSTFRLILLLVFIVIELVLLYSYILTPLFYLFKIRKGISNREASLLIGKHFPNIDDKLFNLLDLVEYNTESDLLLAAIEQRSLEMKPVPFVKAVNFSENLKYVKYIFAPLIVVLLLWLSGNIADFFGSYKRVVNYDVAYEPPAPFSFQLLNDNLNVLEDETLTINLVTEGEIKPENVSIIMDGKELLMQENEGQFQFTFEAPLESANFYFSANGFDSRIYAVTVGKVPGIQSFEMKLNYPNYLNKRSEIFKGTGNALIPEGTRVTWNIVGVHTDTLDFIAKDTTIHFDKNNRNFVYTKSVYNNLEYELATSNKNVKHYESLGYKIEVVKDAYPTVKVEQTLDSLNPNLSYYSGLASDDIGLKNITLVYYPINSSQQSAKLPLVSSNSNVEQFYYTFPSGLNLQEGVDYELYFEVFDNDGLRNGKSTKSQVFRTSLLDDNSLKNRELDAQKSILKNLDKSLKDFKEQKEVLKEINDKQKENSKLNFNDQNQIKDFLQKQERQESMMQKFSKELKDNLNKSEKNDELNELLKERLERQELEAEKNKKLLQELNKIADKINKEDLKKRLEELGKKQSNSERNLEQLLELTKRYYVTEKASQLAKELDKLSKEQNALSKEKLGNESDNKLQKQLNKKFNELSKELEELKKDNEALKKPLDINISKQKEEAVKKDQKEALEEINKHQGIEESSSESQEKQDAQNKASQKQKSAAQKIKEMSENLEQSSSSGGGGSSITEDAEMLRQILDNLITFSFKQENLLDKVQESQGDISEFSTTVREQKQLKSLFEHVDDSLFALSLRRAELSEFVNEQITEVYYNIDKSLESIAENQVYQGASYQQYVLTASNSLADFLAKLLDNMQQSMQPGQGQGQGEGFQLPDIIKEQQKLGEKMGKQGSSGQKGEQGKQGKGQQKKEGQSGEEGESGKDGKSGKDGEPGDNGKEGNKGQDNGQGNSSGGSNGNGPSEQELKEIYEIYKEQQVLRNKLEQQLENIVQKDKQDLAKKLVRQMEDFENDLLENGITQRTRNKQNNIQHQLLKLENAALKQGEKRERESKTNLNQFTNPILTKPDLLKTKTSTIEILNRQALPLRQNYKQKVKDYFKDEG